MTLSADVAPSADVAWDMDVAEPLAPFLKAVFASVSRRVKLLVVVFDELLAVAGSASMCLRELLLVLQRFKALVADCARLDMDATGYR